MNYTELSAAIQQYTENDEASFVTNIPLFVRQAEQRIYNSVQFAALKKTGSLSTASGVPRVELPDDFLAVYALAIVTGTAPTSSYEFLLNKDANFLRQAYPNPDSTGVPRYYALDGTATGDETALQVLLAPTPGAVYTLQLQYFFYPESIVDAGNTWLGDNLDSVLLYGSLLEAYTYMKGDPDILTYYTARYDEALGMAKRLGDGMQRQDAYRSGQARIPVV